MEPKKYKDYEDYFMNRTVADIMEEYSEHEDEWISIPLTAPAEEPDGSDGKIPGKGEDFCETLHQER